MRFEPTFVAVYGLLLLAAGRGLHRLGRLSSSAWSSRVLAGYRQQASEPVEPATAQDWPHSEVPRLHTALALVATAAALLLCAAELVRHHRPAEALLLGAVLTVGAYSAARLGSSLGRSR